MDSSSITLDDFPDLDEVISSFVNSDVSPTVNSNIDEIFNDLQRDPFLPGPADSPQDALVYLELMPKRPDPEPSTSTAPEVPPACVEAPSKEPCNTASTIPNRKRRRGRPPMLPAQQGTSRALRSKKARLSRPKKAVVCTITTRDVVDVVNSGDQSTSLPNCVLMHYRNKFYTNNESTICGSCLYKDDTSYTEVISHCVHDPLKVPSFACSRCLNDKSSRVPALNCPYCRKFVQTTIVHRGEIFDVPEQL